MYVQNKTSYNLPSANLKYMSWVFTLWLAMLVLYKIRVSLILN